MRVMSYNVHRCTGIDRKTSPRRIADLIAHYQPDVVGLQEIDVHRLRTNKEHQARVLAEMLEMYFVFYPAIRESSEHYGDAIFSRYPITPVRFGKLPMPQRRRPVEPRGALWVEVDYKGRKVQMFNTHLGLNPRERHKQVESLLSPEWISSKHCHEPLILCGDFNALPRSKSYQKLTYRLHDCESLLPGRRRRQTFPASYPLYRIDYIFVSKEWKVRDVFVPRTELLKIASDHLPVIAELELR